MKMRNLKSKKENRRIRKEMIVRRKTMSWLKKGMYLNGLFLIFLDVEISITNNTNQAREMIKIKAMIRLKIR